MKAGWREWLAGMLKGPAEKGQDVAQQLALEGEAQRLRLELEESQQTIARLKQELERQRASGEARAAESVQAQMRTLMEAAAGPAAQLITLSHLADVQGKAVQARDVLAVGRSLVSALQAHGLQPVGTLGETMKFDPDQHEALSSEQMPQPGQPVVVRFVGLSYQGRLIRKVGVS